LHPFGQFRNLRTNGTSPQASCSLAGVRYAANKWPSVSTARCTLRPRRFLAPSKPAAFPLSGVLCTVRLSSTTALGCASRPSAQTPRHVSSANFADRPYTMLASRAAAFAIATRSELSKRSPLNTSRKSCSPCGASSRINLRYAATNAHSSSLTSPGYAVRSIAQVDHPSS